MTFLFLLSTGFVLYTYVLFPLILALRVRLREARGGRERLPPEPEGRWPTVSVVIAAHNEAESLPLKLASLAALDYPRDRLEVLIVSDGSTDDTVAVLEKAAARSPALRVHHYADAAGKPTALNVGVTRARGEVLVFMDARQAVSADALRALVRRLGDPRVGAVSGELVLVDASGQATGVGLYWRYEKWIRHNESRLFSTTGATGALYAIRREHWVPHMSGVLLDDFVTPIQLLRRGLRTVFEPAAIAYDQPEAAIAGEFRRKVRTLAGNYQSFRWHPWLFDPRRNPVWWQFLSHKVFRLFVPYALITAFVAAALGDTFFLRAMFWCQLLFYGLGLAAALGVDTRPTNFVRTFVQLNAAAVIGALRYVSGGASVRWRQTS